MSFSLLTLTRQILGSLCQILLRPVRCWTKPDNHLEQHLRRLEIVRGLLLDAYMSDDDYNYP